MKLIKKITWKKFYYFLKQVNVLQIKLLMNKKNHRRKKNAQYPKNQKKKQIKEKEKKKEDIKDINKLKYEEMRYFGKNINNITSLKESNILLMEIVLNNYLKKDL